MLTDDMRALYKRLSVLGILCACLYVFGFSTVTENALARRLCTQDCIAWHNEDLDNCANECPAGTCADYHSCITTADNRYNTCFSGSLWCSNSTASYSPHCQVGYADHCPIIGGVTNCSDPSAHSGYYQLCDYGPGGSQCVSCPNGETCTGANGAPPCF